MSEEAAQPTETAEVAKSLDDVIAEFNVQPTQSAEPTPALQPASEQAPPQQQRIDPYDEDSLNQWAANTQKNQSALQQEIQNLKATVTAKEEAEAKRIYEADIKSATDKITKNVEGLDPLMAELYLNKRAEENPGFKSIWENRNSNPAAFNAALEAISTELDGKFARVDPQIAENHRAAQQSQQSNTTAASTSYNNSYEERLAGAKTEQERQVIWSQIKNGG